MLKAKIEIVQADSTLPRCARITTRLHLMDGDSEVMTEEYTEEIRIPQPSDPRRDSRLMFDRLRARAQEDIDRYKAEKSLGGHAVLEALAGEVQANLVL